MNPTCFFNVKLVCRVNAAVKLCGTLSRLDVKLVLVKVKTKVYDSFHYLIQDKEHLILGRSFIERVYFFQSRLPRNIIVFMINPLAFFSSEQRMNVERRTERTHPYSVPHIRFPRSRAKEDPMSKTDRRYPPSGGCIREQE